MRSMQRVGAILESVVATRGPATPARVSAEIELSLSTVSRIMRDLAEELIREGHEVSVLAPLKDEVEVDFEQKGEAGVPEPVVPPAAATPSSAHQVP